MEVVNLFFRYWGAFLIPMTLHIAWLKIAIGDYVNSFGIFVAHMMLVYDLIFLSYWVILYVIMRRSNDFKKGVKFYQTLDGINQLDKRSAKRHSYESFIESNKKVFKVWCFKNGYEHANKMDLKEYEKKNPKDVRINEAIHDLMRVK